VVVAYLVASRSALSYAVGEWARIWPLQTLVRALGAFFVRRNSGDPLYRQVLARYVQTATAAGVVQAVYPEGRLTRNGRLGPPRLGLISYMVSAFDPKGERDLVFIPVGLNFDRILEDRTLIREIEPEAVPRGLTGRVRTASQAAAVPPVRMRPCRGGHPTDELPEHRGRASVDPSGRTFYYSDYSSQI